MESFTTATHETPVGPLLTVKSDAGLVWVVLLEEQFEGAVAGLERRGAEVAAGEHADVAKQLLEYFDGRRRSFDIPLDWRLTSGFRERAQRALLGIAYGETATYTELAARADNPRAVRAAGTACASNPLPIVVPCHRVVRADGSIGRYGGGAQMKRQLLDLEAKYAGIS